MDNLECAKNMPKEMVGSQKKLHYTMTTIKIQLKLSEKPDIKQEIEYVENKKEQSNPKGSDCSQLAER